MNYANCFEGYLTEGCKDCPDWCDGSNGSIGCGTKYPIDWCPYFSSMWRKNLMKAEEDIARQKAENEKAKRTEMYKRHFNKKRT